MDSNGPLQIQLLYFAALRERMQSAGETVLLPNEVTTVASLGSWLERERPRLRGALTAVRYAVGDEFATAQQELRAGDVVALLPPVSGG